MRGLVAMLAFWLAQQLALDPKPALAAAWALILGAAAVAGFAIHIVINGG